MSWGELSSQALQIACLASLNITPYTGLSNQTQPPILFLDAKNDAMMRQPELRMLQIHTGGDQE